MNQVPEKQIGYYVKKCNLQLEKIKEQEQIIKDLQKSLEEQKGEVEKNNFIKFSSILSQIIIEMVNENTFISYKNITNNSKNFYRVRKEVFDRKVYSKIYGELERERFIEHCIKTLAIKKNPDKGYFFPDLIEEKRKNVVLIRKDLVRLIET